MRGLFPGLMLAALLTLLDAWVWPGDSRTAHKLHYRGTLHYLDGRYQKAVNHFQRAYSIEPDNFNFALSFGLGLGRVGKTTEALRILQDSQLYAQDPSFRQKQVLKLFFEGMVYAYAGHYHQAIPQYRKSIEMQRLLNEPEVLSVMYNALGYAVLMNQGGGGHGRDNLPPHYHVHKRDMLKALDHFERSLEQDPANESALQNYQVLADSLNRSRKVYESEAAAIKALRSGNTYSNLPDNIARAMEFAEADEVVLLLDISGSMVMEKVACKGANRFDVMKETMQLMLDQIRPETSVGIGTIGGDCGTEPRLWYRTNELTRKDLRRHLRFLVPDGTTPLLTMLKESPALFSEDPETEKAIFLVSDGANVCGADGLDICEWAAGLAGQHITINVLTFLETNFGNTNAFAEYSCLSDNTYGRILYIDNYHCRLERYEFDLLESCQFVIPEFQRVDCWGPAVKDLWAIFDE